MDPVAWLLGLGSLLVFGIVVVHLLTALVLIIPTWRICTRAGFSGALSLFHLVPLIGPFIVMARAGLQRLAQRRSLAGEALTWAWRSWACLGCRAPSA